MTMKRTRITTVGTLTAALILPLAPAAAQASTDPAYAAAQDAVYAAAYRTQLAAQWAFQSTTDYYDVRSEAGLVLTESVKAWVDNETFGDRAAAVEHTFHYASGKTETERYGSVERRGSDGYTAWYQLPTMADASKADKRVLALMPAAAPYVKGVPPAGDSDRFTPNSVTRNLREENDVPWAIDTVIDSCDRTYTNATVECSVIVADEGPGRTWTFTIVKTIPDQPQETTTVKLKADGGGYLTYQQVDRSANQFFGPMRKVSEGYVGASLGSPISVPIPQLKGASFFSKILTREAATQAARQLSKKYRTEVTRTLAEAKKPLTQANLTWAQNRLSAANPQWWYVTTNQWTGFSGIGWTGTTAHVDATAGDYLTATRATIEFHVKGGKLTSTLRVD